MSEYLKHTESFVLNERTVLATFLNSRILEELINACLDIFITQRLDSFLDEGWLQTLMDSKDFPSLALLYKFLSDTKNIQSLSSCLSLAFKVSSFPTSIVTL